MFLRKIKIWLRAVRALFFTASVVSILLGSSIAWAKQGDFYLGYFLLTLVAGILLHAGTNVANDYFDHKSGTDDINVDFVRPYTGGSRVIQNKLLSPREMLIGSLIFFSLGSLIGLYLAYQRGWVILLLGIIGVFSGFFYTAPPFQLVNRGVGEFVVGLNFGILMTLGAYYVQARALDWEPLIASIPITLLIAAVLYINEFQDYMADRAVGKKHLVVRLGRQRAERLYELILGGAYLSIVIGIVTKGISAFALLALLTFPIASRAIRTAKAHFDDNLRLVPANSATVRVHLLTGLLLSLAYLLEGSLG